MKLITPHVKEKSSAAVAQLGGFYSGSALLAFIFNSPLVIAEREVILTALGRFMAARGRKRALPCCVSGCELPRLFIPGAS